MRCTDAFHTMMKRVTVRTVLEEEEGSVAARGLVISDAEVRTVAELKDAVAVALGIEVAVDENVYCRGRDERDTVQV